MLSDVSMASITAPWRFSSVVSIAGRARAMGPMAAARMASPSAMRRYSRAVESGPTAITRESAKARAA